ncbi:MAG: hypothetical protein OXC40_06785 [Proteobacteria bacterium]|nr:hypothetical protein [Pseudomonadota bacterium]
MTSDHTVETPDNESPLDDKSLYYAFLDQILLDELTLAHQNKVDSYLKSSDHQNILSLYRTSRGQIQDWLGQQYLVSSEFEKIRELAKKMKVGESRQDIEEKEELAIHELKGLRQRRLKQAFVYGVFCLALILLGRSFFPKNTMMFEPVEALSYETKVLEDPYQLNERIELKTSSLSEIREYFLNHPKLSWDNTLLNLGQGWAVVGASVLDYETANISLVVYRKQLDGHDILELEKEVVSADGLETRIEVVHEKIPRYDILVHYSFDSKNNYLPSFKPSIEGGVEYYTYESDQYNIIMWRRGGSYHLIIGRVSPVEMASYVP